MLTPAQTACLEHLLLVASDDLGRSFSAAWSTAKLHTLLIHAVLRAGHRVLEPSIPGTPAHGTRTRRGDRTGDGRRADLKIVLANDDRPMHVELLSALTRASDDAPWSLPVVHRALERLSAGAVDALLIHGDGAVYERLHVPAQGAAALRQHAVVVGVLPRVAKLILERPHMCAVGDVTLATIGCSVQAFGATRFACAVYPVPY